MGNRGPAQAEAERGIQPALVFIGFMGAGKSTALAVARRHGLETTEVDERMEAALGLPLAEAFERGGEAAFRECEAEVVGRLLEDADGGAIALGGGSVLSERVRSALGRHLVVWLQVGASEAWRRIEGTARPLARSEDDVRSLLEERLPLYEQLADVVILPAGPEVVERAWPAIDALRGMPAGTRMIWAVSGSGEYPIVIGPGVTGSGWWPLESRRFCITDSAVGPLYADRVAPLAATVEVEPGEGAKSLSEAERVLRELTAAGMTRGDHVVALGGGVVGDLAGFCAHTFQRGVPVVQVPTTVVAQVDSAYGGKTGVDLPEGKNYVGAFHLPAAVIADPDLLGSLPGDELAAGFVEVIKTGLLAGGGLWARVERIAGPEDLTGGGHLPGLVFSCALYKSEIVAADERDAGLRAVLNLGHTVGHAIEAAAGYGRYRHGEAVGLGLLAALRLSGAGALRSRVGEMLAGFGLPRRLSADVGIGAVLDAIERDKKRTAAGVGFVLLAEPGRPQPGQIIDPGKVEDAVRELYE